MHIEGTWAGRPKFHSWTQAKIKLVDEFASGRKAQINPAPKRRLWILLYYSIAVIYNVICSNQQKLPK